MNTDSSKIVILGLSITSSWGNGHATTYRGLVRELVARGNDVLFLERDMPWYAAHRDLMDHGYGRVELYTSVADLRERFASDVMQAGAVILGSYVPEGVAVGEWVLNTAVGVTAFYDIDTPVTLGKFSRGAADYLLPSQIPRYDLYLSFTGGPMLRRLEQEFGSPRARALYCSVDPEIYFPEEVSKQWDLGYLGTHSADRHAALHGLMLDPARRWPSGRFVVAGPQYPDVINWPSNVQHLDHIPPSEHRRFYNKQTFTLNLTRAEMIKAGYSPSVRLFEAAACGTPVISDYWDGLEDLFRPGEEVLISRSGEETLQFVREIPAIEAREIGARARRRVLDQHTAAHRAAEVESHLAEAAHDRLR